LTLTTPLGEDSKSAFNGVIVPAFKPTFVEHAMSRWSGARKQEKREAVFAASLIVTNEALLGSAFTSLQEECWVPAAARRRKSGAPNR
jgi:hypothetical protein